MLDKMQQDIYEKKPTEPTWSRNNVKITQYGYFNRPKYKALCLAIKRFPFIITCAL